MKAFEKARTAALARKKHKKFGRGGLAAFQRRFVSYLELEVPWIESYVVVLFEFSLS